MTKFLLILLGVNVAALIAVTILYRRARKAQRRRRIEAPNSQYKSQYVMDLEAKQRWEALDLSFLHEVNREEFEKILGKVRRTSVRELSTQERAFLDRMVEAERRVRRSAREANSTPPARPLHGTS